MTDARRNPAGPDEAPAANSQPAAGNHALPAAEAWIRAGSALARIFAAAIRLAWQAASQLRHKVRGNATMAVTAVCAVLSFGLTAWGIGSLLKDMGVFVAASAGAFLSLVISTMVLAFWTEAFQGHHHGLRVRAFLFLMAAISSFMSISLGSATTSFLSDGDAYEADAQGEGVSVMLEPLSELRRQSVDRAVLLQQMSGRMTEMSRRESNVGGTCADAETGASCGPVCRMRQRLAREAAGHAVAVQAVVSASTELMSGTGRLLDQSGWSALYRRGSDLANDPRSGAALAWARTARLGFSDGFVDEETGEAFVCRDPATERALDSLIVSLETDIGFPAAPPIQPETGFTDVVAANLSALFDFLLAKLFGGDDYDVDALRRLAPSWFIAAVVELALISTLKVHLIRLDREAASRGKGQADVRRSKAKTVSVPEVSVPGHQRTRMRKLLSIVLAHTVEDVSLADRRGRLVGRRYFFIPMVDGAERRKLDWARSEMGFRGHEAQTDAC